LCSNFDTAKIRLTALFHNLGIKPVLIVMDYAFGEQYMLTVGETIQKDTLLNVESVSIMGRILEGGEIL
jgi:hypothetical protein